MPKKFVGFRLMLGLLTLVAHHLQAQQVVSLGNETKDVALSPYAAVCRAHLGARAMPILLKNAGHFAPNDSRLEVNYGFNQKSGWCKFSITNHSANANWVLMVQQARVDTVQLYLVRHDSIIQAFPVTGHFQPLPKRSIQALPFAFPLTLTDKGDTITAYLYSHRELGRHAAIVNLQSRAYFDTYQHFFMAGIGTVCGMILLATLIGFVLYLLVRERVYIYYSVYAFSFFLLLVGDTGLAHALISVHGNQTVVDAFTMIFYYWIAGWHLLFTVELLQMKKYHRQRWLYWIGLYCGYFFCAGAILQALPFLPLFIRSELVTLSYYLIFPMNIYLITVLLLNVGKGKPVVYLYAAGFFTTVIVATLLILSDFEVLNIPHFNKDLYYLTPLPEVLCIVMGFGIQFSRNLKDRFLVQLKLSQTQDQIITIQEDERRRIAQDLHDDVGNSLAAVRNMVVQKKEPADVEREIGNVIQTIRTISHNLIPVDMEEFSLAEIVGHVVNKFKDHPDIALEFTYSGQVKKLKPLTELVIYRIINELITNIFKHSKASKALIQLLYQQQSLVVTVEDNGTGIIKKNGFESGIGLRSIHLRAEYIQASLNVESDAKGTLVILEIPYDHGEVS